MNLRPKYYWLCDYSTGRARPGPGDMPRLSKLLCFCSVCLTSKGSPQEKQIALCMAQPDFWVRPSISSCLIYKTAPKKWSTESICHFRQNTALFYIWQLYNFRLYFTPVFSAVQVQLYISERKSIWATWQTRQSVCYREGPANPGRYAPIEQTTVLLLRLPHF